MEALFAALAVLVWVLVVALVLGFVFALWCAVDGVLRWRETDQEMREKLDRSLKRR